MYLVKDEEVDALTRAMFRLSAAAQAQRPHLEALPDAAFMSRIHSAQDIEPICVLVDRVGDTSRAFLELYKLYLQLLREWKKRSPAPATSASRRQHLRLVPSLLPVE
jgi:hypothetical protein